MPDELKLLNAKVLDGTVTQAEEKRLAELREEQRSRDEYAHQRRYARSDGSLPVRFGDKYEFRDAYYAFNFGAGGLALRVEGDFQVDSELDLEVCLPGDDEASVVRARVAWAELGAVGFEFLQLDEALRKRIDALAWDQFFIESDSNWTF